MDFLHIETINDIYPFIENKDAVSIREFDEYSLLIYNVEGAFDPQMFNDKYTRECRGLKFDKSGKIIGRPFHKFRNLNETDAYRVENIDWTKPHKAYEKFDGSMIHTTILNDELVLMTKGGITYTSHDCEEFCKRENIWEPLKALVFANPTKTYIFEYWAYSTYMVVLPKEPQLVHIGTRDMHTGEYLDDRIDDVVPIHDTYHDNERTFSTATLDAFYAKENTEGVVVAFEDGFRVKVKTEWYSDLHHSVSSLFDSEREVVKMVALETLDDLIAILNHENDTRVDNINAYVKDLTHYWNETFESAYSIVEDIRKNNIDRKKFYMSGRQKELNRLTSGIVSMAWTDASKEDMRDRFFKTLKELAAVVRLVNLRQFGIVPENMHFLSYFNS